MLQQQLLSEPATLHVHIAAHQAMLEGTLTLPPSARGLVIFAHGGSGGRLSPRSRAIVRRLNEGGFATLLFELLMACESAHDVLAPHRAPDLALLGGRLLAATDQARAWPESRGLPIGYFGAGAGATAALLAAPERRGLIGAIVSLDGRPDRASARLAGVRAPTLLVVAAEDHELITRNEAALGFLPPESSLALVPRAGRRFEQPGALERAAQLAAGWFGRFLG